MTSQAGTLSIVMADILVSMAVIVVISGVARNLVLLERKSSRDRDSGRLPEGNLGNQGELLAGLSGNYQWRLHVTKTSPCTIFEVCYVEKGREWEWISNTQRAKDTNSRKTRGCMVSAAKMSEIIHIDVPNSFIEAFGSLHWPVPAHYWIGRFSGHNSGKTKKHWQPRLRMLANWVLSSSRVSRRGKCECTERAGGEGTRTTRSRICSTPTHSQHWTPVERSSKAEFCVKPTWNGIRPVSRDGVSVYTYFDSVDYNSFKNNI